MLERLRRGQATLEDLQLLSLKRPLDEDDQSPFFWRPRIRLNQTVDQARTANSLTLKALKALVYLDSEADRFGQAATDEMIASTCPLPQRLLFTIGAQVRMVTSDPRGEWSRGDLGRVVGIPALTVASDPRNARHGDDRLEYPVDQDDLMKVYIEFPGGGVIAVPRCEWKITVPTVVNGKLEDVDCGSVQQFPFVLGWHAGVAEVVGLTLPRVAADLMFRSMPLRPWYSMFSRCASLVDVASTHHINLDRLDVDHEASSFLAGQDDPSRGPYCAVEATWVGDSKSRYARVVDLAVAFPDGTTMQSFVTPGRDVTRDLQCPHLSAADLQLAPTLTEAWATMAPKMRGLTLVSSAGAELLRVLDMHMKRDGVRSELTSVARPRVDSPCASTTTLERARSTLAMVNHHGVKHPASPYRFAQQFAGGYRLQADGTIVLSPGTSPDQLVRSLTERIVVAPLSEFSEAALSGFEKQHRVDLPRLPWAGAADPFRVLHPGIMVGFTGQAFINDLAVPRAAVETFATMHGLLIDSRTRSYRWQVLVATDVYSQSAKARYARERGRPIVAFDDFVAWCGSQPLE